MVQITLDAHSNEGRMVKAANPTSPTNPTMENANALEQELVWFTRVLDTRFKLYFQQETNYKDVCEIEPPVLAASLSPYANFIDHYEVTFSERITLILALIPHIRPQLLDVFFTKNKTFDRKFTEFGGTSVGTSDDFFPTIETLTFILAANNLQQRFDLQFLFDANHIFSKHHVFEIPATTQSESLLKRPLKLTGEFFSLFTTGQPYRPEFDTNFPAQFIETQLNWNDLVLHPGTLKQVEEISTWIEHGQTLMSDWQMAAKLRPGYRSLFYGPPGTGKTMTACLLGKTTGRDVYKIDLSLVVSKYIGETEKNLSRVFNQAQQRGWILFFDEADALFGKRVESKSSHDRYANQEVSYLLQRIESFDGIVILASNLKDNLDTAFMRRFESATYFPMPRAEERLRLWQQGFSKKAKLDKVLDLEKIAREYMLSGGSVMNVIRYASLQSLKEKQRPILLNDVLNGIKKEYAKEGKG